MMSRSEKLSLLGLLFMAGVMTGIFFGIKITNRRVDWAKSKDHLLIDSQEVPSIEPCWQGCRTQDDITCEDFRRLLRR
jgi:hypothetical protein